MRRHSRRESGTITHAFDHAGNVRCTVELGHLARHADVSVHERLVVNDHVLVGRVWVGGFFEAVGLASEEVCPQLDLDEMQERNDVAGAELAAGGFAVEEEVEELETYGVALKVESRKRRIHRISL